MLLFQQKNDSFVFDLPQSRSQSPFFSLSFVGLPPTFSFSQSFSCSIFQICGHAIDLSLILQTTRIQKQFPLSVFVFIDSLVVSASQDAGGYAISRQNNLELHLGCHTCLLSYFTLVCLWCGRTVRQAYGHVITKFSQRGRHAVLHFLSHGAPWPALRTRELHNNAWATCTDFKLL